MDFDSWTGRLAAAKRQFGMQNSNRLGHSHIGSQLDDFDVEEEIRSDYRCPYCYAEFEIGSLCSHLEDEHPCESKPTGCPICSLKVAGNMLNHITLQHGHFLKISSSGNRRLRLRRVPIPSSQALSLLGRDLREAHLQVLLGGTGYRPNNSTSSAGVTDNFFSSLISNLSTSDSDEISKSLMSSSEETLSKSTSQHMWQSSLLSSLSHEEREQRIRQAAGRAVFVQDLLVSTLLVEQ